MIKRERTLKSDLDTKGENSVTWLSDFDIKDFLHVFIVGGDLEHGTGRVLDTRDVDRDNVSRHSLPSHVVPVAMDSKNLGPQSVQTKKKITESRNLKIFYSENNKMAIFYIKFF